MNMDEPGFVITQYGKRCKDFGLERTADILITQLNNHSRIKGTRHIRVEVEEAGWKIYRGRVVIEPLEGTITGMDIGSTGGWDNKLLRSASPEHVRFDYKDYEYLVYFRPQPATK